MNKTLLIMAAGMGSRYGGLKQIEGVGPNNEFIIDYSIFDAIRSGFNKVVFIIRKENYNIFKETIGKRIEKVIKVEYVFQEIDTKEYKSLSERIKPLGTAHAILCAKEIIKEPFVIINSDDFYGCDAYKVISEFLDKKEEHEYGIVGYKVINTLTENGSVKRGVCEINDNNLTRLIESSIIKKEDIIECTALSNNDIFTIKKDTLVSMNMMAFTPNIFKYIETNFKLFLEENKNDLSKCEYLIPDVLSKGIKENIFNVKVIPTNAKWVGVTYKEDKEEVVNYINKLILDGEYPSKLWK